MQIRKMSLAMQLITVILLSTVAAVAGNVPSQDSPLRTVHGTVVDANGETVPTSVVYLYDEQTHAVRTYIADDRGRYRFSGIRFHTDYRIHAEHNGLASSVRKIPAHSANKQIKLDLKLLRKRPASVTFNETSLWSIAVIEQPDRSSKRARLEVPKVGARTT